MRAWLSMIRLYATLTSFSPSSVRALATLDLSSPSFSDTSKMMDSLGCVNVCWSVSGRGFRYSGSLMLNHSFSLKTLGEREESGGKSWGERVFRWRLGKTAYRISWIDTLFMGSTASMA